ncbi:MAG: hypothetical protein HYV60_22410 [Planctomycetia bacterium]|nr:hypothetical protein [Planctomycetia bacterium]
MMHIDRVWCRNAVTSSEELARKLTEMTWCGCTAFAIDRYLWLNDATSPDAAQEYAVLLHNESDGSFLQIESITMSWCSYDEVLQFVEQTLRGEDDCNEWARLVQPTLQTAAEHGRCLHCA